MQFTDIFIRRPVLATVVSLLILLVGLRAYFDLTVRQYPQSDKAVVTVQTTYVGADAELVKGFITTPLEKEIASADGIDYLQSTSAQGVSVIQANLELNYNPIEALTQITSKVNKVRSELPEASEDPVIDVQVGETTASMYMSFTSEVMEPNQITDYLNRVVVPELSTVAGVESAEIIGGRRFAMRIWLDPDRLAAYNLTPREVRQRLAENNFLAAVGSTKGNMVKVALDAATDLSSEQEFRELVVRESGGTLVRLGDVAEVELGAETYDNSAINTGREGPFVGITVLPLANELTVIQDVREKFPEITAQFPQGLRGEIVYDATEYIEEAINEVVFTLGLALAIVTLVIYLFMGSMRSVLVPVLAIPLSLVGVGTVMLMLGFSINLLTLLALVLAIGLVVDDAIIVAENIHRHIEDGMKPVDAAIRGARELGTAIIAMSLTLIAVYLPIGFTGGLTGSLFTEFAFTLAGAVFISGIVAITFSPMLCSKVLKPHNGNGGGFQAWLDDKFERLRGAYQRRLHGSLDFRPVTYVFAATVVVSCYFLFIMGESELAPVEDQNILFVQATAQPNATLKQLEMYTREMTSLYEEFPEYDRYFLINGFAGPGQAGATNRAISGMALKPWGQRERSQMEIKPEFTQKMRSVAGLDTAVFERPPLPGSGGGLPVQFVVGSTAEPDQMREAVNELAARAQQSGLFLFTDLDLKFDRPQVTVNIDREAVADLGLTMQQVGSDLSTMMGGNLVNRFSIQGRAYEVIPQVVRGERLNADQLENYYIRSADGRKVPMSAVVSLETNVEPRSLARFQQLNAATLSAVPTPGVTIGQALDYLRGEAAEVLPSDYKLDYAGQSRQFVEEGNALIITFFFAIILIYLVLAAQFESFRDPIIMLVTVPMSVAGALAFITVGVTTINIYTQVGLITLIGLISKHGILIVEFANQLQAEGRSKREAIEEAASLRLRPILMTTAATVMGIFPLVIATGAGAASRFSMGVVIVAGMSIGTLFTLFVVPAIYMLLARDRRAEAAESGDPDSRTSAPGPA